MAIYAGTLNVKTGKVTNARYIVPPKPYEEMTAKEKEYQIIAYLEIGLRKPIEVILDELGIKKNLTGFETLY